MALLLKTQWQEHALNILKLAMRNSPSMIDPLLHAAAKYVGEGEFETQSNRMDAMDIFLTTLWKTISVEPFDSHRMKHFLSDAGVDERLLRDIPEKGEPSV